ncbi:tyrosine-type recombinase/integrase [Microbulbifer variabilis]|uniref:tyrosine-type recombinase/integrase n=1 Tax=Microbulbifer variabilis TaxID=266805 RepID=UPI001CFDCDF1|nr:site-specific integrase [Microbulbifer variabilis]
MGKLTVKGIEGIKTPGKYDDGDGLRLFVQVSGARSWVLRYQLHGKRREMGLGSLNDVSLKQARVEAGIQKRLILQGVDPVEERRRTQQKQKAAAQGEKAKTVMFRDMAADYIEAHRGGWKSTKHTQQWENTLQQYAFPVIGDKASCDVSTDDVLEMLKPIWLEKPETASRVRNRVELVLDAAKARGLREGENPARWRGHLDKLLPKRSKVRQVKHHSALPWAELPEFMLEIAKREGLAFRAMELTILTATRTSEVLEATWDEIDFEAKSWTIPAERMKAGKEHRVPLAPPVIALLESIPRVDDSRFLFPGRDEGRPLSNMAMLMALRRVGRGDLTVHGFRSTFRDWAGEMTPHPRDVCEQALAHSLGDSVEAAYRRGDLFEKRKSLMADWAAYATTALADNVVSIRK